MQAAKSWGQRPSDVGLCAPEEDIVYMVAWERTENLMLSWERQEQEREAKKRGAT